MAITQSLEARRSIYQLNKELPVTQDEVVACIEKVTELVPDAFNMKSARVLVALGAQSDALWDAVFEAFDGKVAREKINSFAAGAGTLLYFIDTEVVAGMQEQFPRYAENFFVWANQANGMLQLSVWTALADMGIGANIQHYNPVIDDALKELFELPASWKLIAQMPFGGIVAHPDPKEREDIAQRVIVKR